MAQYNRLLDNNQKKCLVIGDLMLDHYVFGKCDRISPEAPVPVFEMESEKFMLGGAGNVVNNLAAFGINCDVIGVIGKDKEGEILNDLLKSTDFINTDGVFIDDSRCTTLKKRLIASGQQLLRLDSETRETISVDLENKLISFINKRLNEYSLVLISDYNKGVVSESLCKKIIPLCKDNGILVIVDPKGKDFSKYSYAHLIKPNLKELFYASGIENIDLNNLSEISQKMKNQLNLDAIIVTLGDQGIFVSHITNEIISTKANRVYDVSGAGDTVFASIAICLLNNFSLLDSCIFANAAASIVIQKIGSETVSIKEVILKINEDGRENKSSTY